MSISPYTPGAGVKPYYLAGRDDIIKSAKATLDYLNAGRSHQSCIYYGLRGVGKTVLLNEIEDIVDEYEYVYEHIEISERDNFKTVIAQYLQKIILKLSTVEKVKGLFKNALGILKGFTFTIENYGEFTYDIGAVIGKADTGNFQNDLTELFLEVGLLAYKADKKIIVFIDEIQYLKEDDFEAIIAAIHRIQQKNLPIIIFGAGLPKIAKMAGDAKSYSERLFDFIEIDSLKEPNAKAALIEPAKKYGVTYEINALDEIIKITEGYPYFLQEFGNQVWMYKKNNIIDMDAVYNASEPFFSKLDESFFKVRYDRATPNEKKFMFVMADLGDGPYEISSIARDMKKEQKSIGIVRAKLINKGFIYSTSHGYLDFTVPQFGKYLKRIRASS